MTPEEKIAELVKHIKKEFPEGCADIPCIECPLCGVGAHHRLCEMLKHRIRHH